MEVKGDAPDTEVLNLPGWTNLTEAIQRENRVGTVAEPHHLMLANFHVTQSVYNEEANPLDNWYSVRRVGIRISSPVLGFDAGGGEAWGLPFESTTGPMGDYAYAVGASGLWASSRGLKFDGVEVGEPSEDWEIEVSVAEWF